jgi:accessory gene regulator protein AgrB
VEKLKKHFNLWVVLSLPFLILITNQIHVVLSLGVLFGAIVGLGISYDQISFEYDEKEKLG